MLEIKKSSFLKYNFFESELKLLGVVFSKAGKKIDSVKVQTITVSGTKNRKAIAAVFGDG